MIDQLAENYPGSLYNQIPKGLYNIGSGGVNKWGSLCGIVLGGAAVLNIVTGNSAVIDEYMAWYERAALPSNAAYEDYADGGWTISSASKQPKDGAPMSVPKTLLCHASHGRWLEAAGGSHGAWVTTQFAGDVVLAGKDRCAKLTYGCSYKVCELINDFMAGTIPTPVLDPSVTACLTSGCHGGYGHIPEVVESSPHVTGKMKCDESCHK